MTIGTTTVKICSYNPKRRSITIYNQGSGTLYISQDPTRVFVDGFPVPNSAVVTLLKEDGDQPELDLYGMADKPSTVIRIQEGFGEGE